MFPSHRLEILGLLRETYRALSGIRKWAVMHGIGRKFEASGAGAGCLIEASRGFGAVNKTGVQTQALWWQETVL